MVNSVVMAGHGQPAQVMPVVQDLAKVKLPIPKVRPGDMNNNS